MDDLTFCRLCPRECGANRHHSLGFCGAGDRLSVSKIMLHHWEEPPISGSDPTRGSGAVFFTHCPLGCVYCQNRAISRPDAVGQRYTPSEMADELLRLEEAGAYNVNFVSPTPYTSLLRECVALAKSRGLTIPIVWNTGGYERPDVIRTLTDTVDIFLTDFKYASPEPAGLCSAAPDYPDFAADALAAMFALTGPPQYDENGMLRRGVIVRHLVLPGQRKDSLAVLERIAETVPPDGILLSLMAQYTPDFLPDPVKNDPYAKLRRRVTSFEYRSVADAAEQLGFDGFLQDRASATAAYTPDFS